MTENLFITATREGYEFSTARGPVTVVDLWKIPLRSKKEGDGFNLDAVAKAVNADLKSAEEGSFVDARSPKTKVLENKLEVVKFVIATLKAEEAAKAKAADDRVEAMKIREILAQQQDKKLANEPEEVLRARLATLEANTAS